MVREPQGRGGMVAAGALAVLTIFVFFVLQNYGPESAVRRYHEALLHNDVPRMSAVVEGKLDTIAHRNVQYVLSRALYRVRGYRVLRMARSPRKVQLDVGYITDRGLVTILPWIVEKPRRHDEVRLDRPALRFADRPAEPGRGGRPLNRQADGPGAEYVLVVVDSDEDDSPRVAETPLAVAYVNARNLTKGMNLEANIRKDGIHVEYGPFTSFGPWLMQPTPKETGRTAAKTGR